MRERFVRFFFVVALWVGWSAAPAAMVGCGSSKDTHVAAQAAPAATVASSAAAAPAASAAPAEAPPTQVALPTQVAAPWHPLLYRVAGAKPSYLFGTIHIPDPRLATFPPALAKAVGDSDEIVNEMPLDDANDALAMMSSFRLPSGKSLSTELPPALYGRLRDAFTQKGLGMAFPMLEHMKVWAVAAQVALLDHLKDIGTGGSKAIDLAVHDMAKAAGKTTSGLETKAEQLAVFDGLTKDEQARLLEQTLDQRDKDAREGKDPVARLMTLYVAGEEAPLLHELNAGFDLSRPLDKKLLTRLITDRNKRMVTRITALFKAHPRRAYFVAVGAAHLLGDDGIVKQLEKKGMRIQRVQ